MKTAVKDAVAGLVLGSAGGAAVGNVEKFVRGKLLKNYGDIDKLSTIARQQYNKNSRNYYQDYNQRKIIDKNGPIEFTNRGQKEVLRWNPKQAQNFPELINDIKNAEKLPNMANTDSGKVYTSHFEVYRGKNGDHLIEVNKNGKRRYYTTKDIPEGNLRATSTGTSKNANYIIPQSPQNLNPNLENISKKPSSFDDWLEELKRKRSLVKK